MSALNFQSAVFEHSYGTLAQLPPSTTPEVAFVGRSNVGKSSLMNALFMRKNLVKVSSTPGKTANINFFKADGVRFVDLPGYGFAKVARSEKDRWSDLIAGYFAQNRSFNLIVALIDIRHPLQDLDAQMVQFLRDEALPFIVVLTKADKLSRSKQLQQQRLLAKSLGIDVEQTLITSSEKGDGISTLKSLIDQAV